MECPKCKGQKKFLAMFPVYADDVPLTERKATFELTCDLCEGAGEIDDSLREQMQLGELLRRERLKAGYGMRELAEVLGRIPSFYADAEQGRKATSVIMELRLELAMLVNPTPRGT